MELKPFGGYAANLLRLSEQLPARVVFLTDGKPRKTRIGRQMIELRRASPRMMAAARANDQSWSSRGCATLARPIYLVVQGGSSPQSAFVGRPPMRAQGGSSARASLDAPVFSRHRGRGRRIMKQR